MTPPALRGAADDVENLAHERWARDHLRVVRWARSVLAVPLRVNHPRRQSLRRR